MDSRESLLEGVERDSFPADAWFTHRVHPKIIRAYRLIYRAYRIDPAPLWRLEYALGRNSTVQTNLQNCFTAAIAESAGKVLEQEVAEDTAHLSADDPLNALDFTTQRGLLATPRAADSATAQPAWRDNRAYDYIASRFQVNRSLTSALEGVIQAPATAPRAERDQATTSRAEPLQADHLPSRGLSEQDGFPVDTGRPLAAQAFDTMLRKRNEALSLGRTQRMGHSEIQPAPERVGAQGHTEQTGEQHPSVSQTNTIPDSQPSASAPPVNTVHMETADTGTPTRRPPVRSTSSPNLRLTHITPAAPQTVLDVTSRGTPLTQGELNKIQENQKRNLREMKLTFSTRDYLEDFTRKLRQPLQRCTRVPQDELAECILAMLGNDVKTRCQGNEALVTPQSPEQIFEMLRNEFPAKEDFLMMDLRDNLMSDQESAVDFLLRQQRLFVKHQVPLPSTHALCMPVYVNASGQFMERVKSAYNHRIDIAKQIGKNPAQVNFGWTELQELARQFDAEESMLLKTKSARKLKGREEKGLQNPPNPHYPVQDSKLRSDKNKTSVSAMDSQPEERGRSSAEYHDSRRRDRSASKSSAGSRYEGRSNPTSPNKHYAGRTPSGGTFKKTPFQRSGSGGSLGANIASQLTSLNWVHVNVIRQIPMSEQDAEIPSPIIINTLQNTDHHYGADHLTARIMAANRRPVRPEGVSPDDLDLDSTPLNLPEAMRRGLQHIQHLPANNPYTKLLNAQFMISFKQLAGLCQDPEFADICKNLLELSLRRDNRQQLVASTRAAVEILQMAFAELPIQRTRLDCNVVQEQSTSTPVVAVGTQLNMGLTMAHMTRIQVSLDDEGTLERTFRLDSGAAVSSISKDAFDRDFQHFAPSARVLHLITPMTLTGFANGHMKISRAVEGVSFVIGLARYTHNFLVVPGLTCDYLLGQDFMLAYDMQVQLVKRSATVGIDEDEWTGAAQDYRPYQVIDISLAAEQADLLVRTS